jgi:predicted RNase H-like nuclease (RuvC/YqgF family)
VKHIQDLKHELEVSQNRLAWNDKAFCILRERIMELSRQVDAMKRSEAMLRAKVSELEANRSASFYQDVFGGY